MPTSQTTFRSKIPTGTHSPNKSTSPLTVYSFASDGTKNILTRYDNFYLIELTDIADKYYFVSEPNQNPPQSPFYKGGSTNGSLASLLPFQKGGWEGFKNSLNLEKPRSVDFEIVSPTKKRVKIHGATTPFYLAMSESYHDQWRAELDNSKVSGFLQSWIPWIHPDAIPDSQHFKLDDFLNGWYIDPQKLCQNDAQGCTKNPNGTYNLNMIIEFSPQRYFYVGLIVSTLTLISCLGYLGYVFLCRKEKQ